jgi:hypothetical protein
VSGFWLEKRSQQFLSTTANVTNQFNLDTGVQQQAFITVTTADTIDRQLISSAPVIIPAQGNSIVAGSFSTELWGTELNARHGCCRVGNWWFGGLAGIRYLSFEEETAFTNTVSVTDLPPSQRVPGVPVGSALGVLPASFTSFDRLRAENRILAPQIGAEMEGTCYGFFLNARAKVGVGANFQEFEATGFRTSTTPTGGTLSTPGGLFSGPTNQGETDRTRIAVIPEAGVKFGYQFGAAFRAYVGYDALYMQHVLRPGAQVSFTDIQTNLSVANSSTNIAVRQPVVVLKDLDVWVQGVNFGLELRY